MQVKVIMSEGIFYAESRLNIVWSKAEKFWALHDSQPAMDPAGHMAPPNKFYLGWSFECYLIPSSSF